jgi:hypothetical protein
MPRQELFNSMWHDTCTQGNLGDYWLLVVESQIGNLIPDLSFSHNLCFKNPNRSCEPILDIYIPRNLQWYKELLNSMGFDLCNRPLKIQKSIKNPTPKVGAHLGVWGFIPSLLHSQEHEMWFLDSLLLRTFASPCFGWKPKAKVTTSPFYVASMVGAFIGSFPIGCTCCSSYSCASFGTSWCVTCFSNFLRLLMTTIDILWNHQVLGKHLHYFLT